MELRSSRSRSRTPFLQDRLEQEVVSGEHHNYSSEVTVTYSSRHRSNKSNNSSILSDEVFSSPAVQKSSRVTRRNRHKTSDYSSEDGENEISSSRADVSVVRANGGVKSALQVYKDAGEYWNKFPKTDYTYSVHSKDRVELAPGVIAMPNMSRRSLHRSTDRNNSASNNHNSSSSSRRSQHHEYYTESPGTGYTRTTETSVHAAFEPKALFRHDSSTRTVVCTTVSQGSLVTRLYRSVRIALWRSVARVVTALAVVYWTAMTAVLWLGRGYYRLVSRVLLLDTWLLQRSAGRKSWGALVALLAVPLLLLGGLHLTQTHGVSLVPHCHPHCAELITNAVHARTRTLAQWASTGTDALGQYSHTCLEMFVRLFTGTLYTSWWYWSSVSGVVVVVPAVASATDTVHREHRLPQLGTPADNTAHLVQQLLASPELADLIAAHVSTHAALLDAQKQDLLQVKDTVTSALAAMQLEHARHQLQINGALSRCCARQTIRMEAYVRRLLGELMGGGRATSPEHVSQWLHTLFVAKHDLETQLANVTLHMAERFEGMMAVSAAQIMADVSERISARLRENLELNRHSIGVESGLSDSQVQRIVKESLAVYDADKTGLVDYALEPSGGQVLSTRCTESYNSRTAVLSVLGIPLWYPSNTPRVVISPGVTPGECWAFQNFPGFLVIQLTASVRVRGFSLEHIPRSLAPGGRRDSAPRDFSVWGLRAENDREPRLLGQYTYELAGPSLQFFGASEQQQQQPVPLFDMVELRVESNHGNMNYTCLYRFRVHGTLNDEEFT